MSSSEDIENGAEFLIPFESFMLTVIVSARLGWETVSVSLPNRAPNWREMCFIKDLGSLTIFGLKEVTSPLEQTPLGYVHG